MKNKFLSFRNFFAVVLLCFCTFPSWAQNPKPFVVPELTHWEGAEGEWLPSGRVLVKGSNKELVKVAEALVADYKELTGKSLVLAKGKVRKGDIVLGLKKHDMMKSEGYRMEVGDQLSLSSPSPRGVYWGTRTLLQLSEQSSRCALPKGIAIDQPEYALRGFMIDCGRKYIPMAYLHNLVKMMAYYKMNTLQVHLNDNGFKEQFGDDWSKTPAAFRLESDTYPGLTAKDGSYSKKEFIDFQKMAENHYLEIIPEIDVPAHSLAFTHYKPELASKDYGADHLDLFNPETYQFVDGLFKEYLEGPDPVFRGKRVHIGTDEYSNAKQEVVEKFRYFTDHYIRFVESFGKQAMCWGALTHANGETPVKSENVVMNCWYNGYADPKAMKKQGYDLVSVPDGWLYIVPAAGYYYDYLNIRSIYEEWTPAKIGNVQFEENDPSILGGMFAVWNDHVGNGISVKDIHHRVYPAMQTLAVKCWTGKHTCYPFADFDKRRHLLSEAPGVNELGRIGQANEEVLACEKLTPGMKLTYPEIGYDYTVTFTVDGKQENKGTELFRSPNAVFYLADPRSGRVGFSRDGYLNCFNYRIPQGKKVTLSIQGNNKMTALYVNGKKYEVLDALTLFAPSKRNQWNFGYEENANLAPEMYSLDKKMYYQRTLVFPLAETGDFNSVITHLKVYNYLKNK